MGILFFDTKQHTDMTQTTILRTGKEIVHTLPARSIQSIEASSLDRRIVRTTGGGLWLILGKYQFEQEALELHLRAQLQRLIEIPITMRRRVYRPAVRC